MMKSFYITTPIYYANSEPHLGHLYTTIVADALNRFKRQRGFDTYFLTGTDEHGINIQRAAEKNDRTPQQQVDHVSDELKRLFSEFELDTKNGGYDIFMRTTEAFHYEGVQNLWKKIAGGKTPKGNSPIYKGFYEGWFCAPCAEFKLEDDYFLAEGSEVPLCKVHERPLDKISEESYFFRLSDYGEALIATIEGDLDLVRPESRRNEVLSFIRSGLQDLSISREKSSVSWGVPVPDDDDHVMYVWLDALSNYITALGFGNTDRRDVGFEKYWENAVHLVGKDILRFHTIYWFSFLMAAEISLPKTVFAHGLWLDGEGRKMSKTIGNVIDPAILKQHFSVDAVRYFVLREMVFGQDGKFSYENLTDRTNSDLAGGLGNLSSRTLSMIHKYREGQIPDETIHDQNFIYAKRAGVNPDSQELASILELARDEYIRHFNNFDFSRALETLWGVIAKIDKMISDAKPWELIKDDNQAETLNAVLYRATETLRWLCVMLHPVMPRSTAAIFSQIGLADDPSQIDPESLKWGELKPGTRIGETSPVFPRIDKNKVLKEIMNNENTDTKTTEKEIENESSVAPAAVDSANAVEEEKKEEDFITIDDFFKVQLKVGEILVAEKIPNADKLLRFEIDLGEEKPRQILAGLAEYYKPEKLVGRKVVVVANLKPRKMRGLESQGMICAASLEGGDDLAPAMATFLEDVKNGARLK